MAHSYNSVPPSIQESKAGKSLPVQGKPRLYRVRTRIMECGPKGSRDGQDMFFVFSALNPLKGTNTFNPKLR